MNSRDLQLNTELFRRLVILILNIPDSFSPDELLGIRQNLEDIAYSLCEILVARFSNEICQADERGYVILKETQSQEKVLIPFHFADSFPIGEPLRSLLEIARQSKASDNGTICFSGSANYFHAVNEFLSDLDFCEYFEIKEEEDRNAFVQSLERTNKQFLDHLISLRLRTKCIQTKVSNDYDANQSIPAHNFDYAQLIFFGTFRLGNNDIDVLEITNLVLPINPNDPDRELLNRTFCMQEAPIGEWIPQRLLEPLDIKRYANFLLTEIKKYLKNKNFVKAAKRALPLSRILFLENEGNGIIDALEPACAIAALESRKKLLERVKHLKSPMVNDLKSRIDKLDKYGENEPNDDILRDAVLKLLNRVDELQNNFLNI